MGPATPLHLHQEGGGGLTSPHCPAHTSSLIKDTPSATWSRPLYLSSLPHLAWSTSSTILVLYEKNIFPRFNPALSTWLGPSPYCILLRVYSILGIISFQFLFFFMTLFSKDSWIWALLFKIFSGFLQRGGRVLITIRSIAFLWSVLQNILNCFAKAA